MSADIIIVSKRFSYSECFNYALGPNNIEGAELDDPYYFTEVDTPQPKDVAAYLDVLTGKKLHVGRVTKDVNKVISQTGWNGPICIHSPEAITHEPQYIIKYFRPNPFHGTSHGSSSTEDL